MRNIDITEWLLNNDIDSDTEIVMGGKQYFLADVLEKHLKEQFAISDVSQRSELLAFKDWFNDLPDESDDRLYITNETIDRFKANCS